MGGYIEIKGIEKNVKVFKEIIVQLLNQEADKIKSVPMNMFEDADLKPEEIYLFYNISGNVVGIGLVNDYEIFETSERTNRVYLKNDKFVLDILSEWLLLDKVKNI